MRTLSASRILEVWERGRGKSPLEMALALLAGAFPEKTPAELADLSVGERDGLLLRLREKTLGSELRGYTECPGCGVTINFTVLVDDVWAPGPGGPREELLTTTDGFELRFRLASSWDLAAAARCGSVAEARATLIRRCVVYARHQGREVASDELPEEVILALSERMEARDPQAEAPLAVACAACGHRWLVLLDIGVFFWTELSTLAERLLYDVHILARFYGWTPEVILSMSAARRQYFLEQASPR